MINNKDAKTNPCGTPVRELSPWLKYELILVLFSIVLGEL